MAPGSLSASKQRIVASGSVGRDVAWLRARERPIIASAIGGELDRVLPSSFPTHRSGGILTPHFGFAKLIYQAQEVDLGPKSPTLQAEVSSRLVAARSLCSDAFERQTLLKGE